MYTKSIEEVKAEFSEKQLDSWIMVGYRQYMKRRAKKPQTALTKFNKALKSKNPGEIHALIHKLRKKIK